MSIIIQVLAVLYAIVVHEFGHAWVARKQGDHTAELAGRLTLNPIAHIDWYGTVLVPAFLIITGSPLVFGWAKPVPINPNNFTNQRWGNSIVSLAGPLVNFVSLIFFFVVLKVLLIGQLLADGNSLITFLVYLIIYNLIFLVFNLIPIPPLDGSKVLFDVLPNKLEQVKYFLETQGQWILLGILVLDSFLQLGILSSLIGFFANLVFSAI
ncbi:MAG: site-2 protease family protein [Candidatus Komeilibacteria bacterium CG_4_10_14_0_2_um_filter_37_10]|uniref:Site-2 protease family protein n=1 Tax=Candidatus Komeilibacteria bacterium CG_4_10_14_0_2_um_filter_37_10 TaxID=1974470 RepID=A0A2M7VEJ1_9BACT|nr:MAG: site-2 protease family protein [Candidatus Komeilibacteria bacterium CG_4_10_14_0_2_um_filter_37_10]